MSETELKEQMRHLMRESLERGKAALVREEQEYCQHLQGCNPLGTHPGSLTSIVWHKFDGGDSVGDVVGICTNCLREFWPTDADYKTWRRLRSGNLMSTGGVEVAVTPGQEAEIRANGYGNLTKQEQQDWGYDDIYLEQIKSTGVDVIGTVFDSLRKK